MLNFILAPLGLLLIGLGVAGLYVAIRGGRRRDNPPRDDQGV